MCKLLRLVEHVVLELAWRVELLADGFDDELHERIEQALREAKEEDTPLAQRACQSSSTIRATHDE